MINTNGSECSSVTPAGVVAKLPVTVDTKGRVRAICHQAGDWVDLEEHDRSTVNDSTGNCLCAALGVRQLLFEGNQAGLCGKGLNGRVGEVG